MTTLPTAPPHPIPYTLGCVSAGPPCCEPVPHLRIQDLSVRYGPHTVLAGVSVCR